MLSGELLTVKQASTLLGVHPNSVRRLLRSNRLPGTKVDGRWRLERDAIEALAAHPEENVLRQSPTASPPSLQRALAEAELLNTITLATSGEENLERILAVALGHLGRVIPFTGGTIALVEDDQLKVMAAVGPFNDLARAHPLPRNQGRVWEVVDSGEPFFSGDVLADGLTPTTPIRSIIVVPLKWRDMVFGLLEVDSAEPHVFSPADQSLMQRVAALLSGSIEMARRYAAEASALAEAEVAQHRLTIQYRVSRALAEATHFMEAVPALLEATGELLGWEFANLWCIDRDANVLRQSVCWNTPTVDAAPFQSASAQLSLPRGVGLPGTAWQKCDPVWIDDIDNVLISFPRWDVARACGIRAGFAFPIVGQQGFFGVFEYFGRDPRAPDEHLVQLARSLGNQLGQYIDGKRAQAAERESRVREGAILEGALDAIVTIDPQGFLTEFNPAAERIFGYKREEVLGKSMADLIIPPAQRLRHQKGLERYRVTGESRILGQRLEFTALRSDGSEFPVELAIIPVSSGDNLLFTAFLRDITERKHIENERTALLRREQAARAEAEAAQARLALLAEASSALVSSLEYDAILETVAHSVVPAFADYCLIDILEEDGELRRVAAAHAWPEKRLPLARLQQEYPPSRNPTAGVWRVLETGKPVLSAVVTDSQLEAAAQDEVHLSLLRELNPISAMLVPFVARERTNGVITLAYADSGRHYNAPDLALAEELARRAALAVDNARLYREAQEAVAARDRFLSIASHELKTPITSIIGYSSLILRRAERSGSASERDQRALQVLQEETTRLNKLVDLLLDISNIETGRLRLAKEPVDLAELAARAVRVLQPVTDKHTLELQVMDEPVPVLGDPLRLEQVLQNLLHNAIKYSPDGGRITVQLGRNHHQAWFTVSDEGIGIPEEELPALFDRFYRAVNVESYRISGMGLGLYITRHIVAEHDGTIGVTSEAGKGSKFTVALPLLPEAVPQGR